MAEAKKEAGNTAFQAGEYDKAIEAYSEAIKLNDLNHVYYANRAAAYLAKEMFEDARSDCLKCISLDKTFVKAYLRLATAQRGLKDNEAALKTIREGMSFFSGGGKKAKKTGLADFKKMEKELKALIAPSKPSGRSAIEEAIMSGGGTDQTQALGQKVFAAQWKLAQVKNEINTAMNEGRGKTLILDSIDKDVIGKGRTDATTFRAMGKAFIQQDIADIVNDIKEERVQIDSELGNLKKGELLCTKNVREAEGNLKEHLSRQN
mmetsp:Transcript_16101/g.26295  ORF Transcript_16101/g.26295 Transcript_16101/m.26295 type:complete len:263 (+) Transcript_16101:175-963(+)